MASKICLPLLGSEWETIILLVKSFQWIALTLLEVVYLKIGFEGKDWWNLISSRAPAAFGVSGTDTAVKKKSDLFVAAMIE